MSRHGGLEDAVVARLKAELPLATLKLTAADVLPGGSEALARVQNARPNRIVVVWGGYVPEETIDSPSHVIQQGPTRVLVFVFRSTGEGAGKARTRAYETLDEILKALLGWEPVYPENDTPFPFYLEGEDPVQVEGNYVIYVARYRTGQFVEQEG